MTLAEVIKSVRGQTTQAEFAKKLNVKQTTLSAYESGKRQPSTETLIIIALLAKMPLEELIEKKLKERRPR